MIHEIEKLVKASGFDYRKEIKGLHRHERRAEFESYSTPDNLEDLIPYLLRTVDSSKEYLDYSGEMENVETFLKRLPRLRIPEGLKDDVRMLIESCQDMNKDSLREARAKLREANKDIKHLTRNRSRLRELSKLI